MVGLLGVLLALAGAALARRSQILRTEARFQSEVASTKGDLEDRFRSYSEVMLGFRGLIRASNGVNRKLFHDYASALELGNQYRGLLAISFSVPVAASDRQAFEQRLQAELGEPGRPFAIRPPGLRPTYFVVIYGEPEAVNRSAIGFDALAIAGQGDSLAQAVDTGRLVASAPVKVIQYDGPDPSLVLRLPVYHRDLPTATVTQRRRALYGCLNGIFRTQDLLQDAIGPQAFKLMDMWFEDLGTAQPGSAQVQPHLPLLGTPFRPQSRLAALLKGRHETRFTLEVGGRIWQGHLRARNVLVGDLAWIIPLFVLTAGTLVALLLARLLGAMNLTTQRARQLALRMTEKLQENESRLQAIAQAVPDLLFVMDEDGRYVEVYGREDDLRAAPRTELMGRTVAEVLPAEVARICLEGIKTTLATHELQTITYEWTTPAGRISFEARLYEMAMALHGKRCVVLVTRDITERSRAEENLRMTQKLESLGVLAGGIAHDFNNLLTAILGNLNLAQMHIPDLSPAAPLLLRVETTVLRAAELAHQMLAYSGRGAFTIELVELNAVVGEMTELLAVAIPKKVTLAFRLAPDLPPLLADRAQLQQVVMNLVTNASEAMEDRIGDITIATGLATLDEAFLSEQFPTQSLEPGRYLTLGVTDTGCGMEPETLERIFDPFFTTKATGRGLGLSAMLGILRGHGAGITIQSEPGLGSSFQVYFRCAEAGPGPASATPPEAAAAPPLHGTILVVDDEPMVRQTARGIIEALGLRVLEACDGLEALDVFLQHRAEIDLVLMDITMPSMDGNEAFLALRDFDPELPVILSSGFTVQEVVQPPAGTRPAEFLQKPYRVADLKQGLQQALQTQFPLAKKS